jgi:hypothetical protein
MPQTSLTAASFPAQIIKAHSRTYQYKGGQQHEWRTDLSIPVEVDHEQDDT